MSDASDPADYLLPLQQYDPLFWVLFFVIIILTISYLTAVFWFTRPINGKGNSLFYPKIFLLNRIQIIKQTDTILKDVKKQVITPKKGLEECLYLIKRYSKYKTNIPVDTMTVSDLKKAHAPVNIVYLVDELYPFVYSKNEATIDTVHYFTQKTKKVLSSWR